MAKIITELYYDNLDVFFKEIVETKGKLYEEFIVCSHNDVCNRYIFRGVPSSDYELIPSVLRKANEKYLCRLSGHNKPTQGITTEIDQIITEDILLYKFFSHCDYNGLKVPKIERFRIHDKYRHHPDKWLPNDLFELAGLAQHYGLPTRLLDWSFNFYIALYFALINANKKDKYCSVWAFNQSIEKWFDRLSETVKIIIPEYSNNPNLMAQKGVFTLWQIRCPCADNDQSVDRRPLNAHFEEFLSYLEYMGFKEEHKMFYKINIPIKFKREILVFLSSIGYDGSTLFPGYEGVTRSIKEFGMIINKYSE
jgi:hypothetical protein